MAIGIGLLGLGTVGAGVAQILQTPDGRHPLVKDLALRQVAVRSLERPRQVELAAEMLTTDPAAVVANPAVDLVVEVMGHPGGCQTPRCRGRWSGGLGADRAPSRRRRAPGRQTRVRRWQAGGRSQARRSTEWS